MSLSSVVTLGNKHGLSFMHASRILVILMLVMYGMHRLLRSIDISDIFLYCEKSFGLS